MFDEEIVSSHTSNLVQGYLTDTLKSRFIKASEWPPSSPDCNPLDYFFWNLVKERVYAGRLNQPFQNEEELKKRIKSVWNECASDKAAIRKSIRQFIPRLHAVEQKKRLFNQDAIRLT